MISASRVREISDSYVDEILSSIETSITEEARKGNYQVSFEVYGTVGRFLFTDERKVYVLRQLIESGYKVSNYYDDTTITVSWRE